MFSHQRCKNCNQRKGMREFTLHCPASSYGHQWETISGNGVSWDESLVGKLWKTTYGKFILVVLALILFLMLS